jgi:hypothetical protein
MSTTTFAVPVEYRGFRRLTAAASDSLGVTWRNLIGLRRTPQLLIFATIQPVIFVLLFRYVFGEPSPCRPGPTSTS